MRSHRAQPRAPECELGSALHSSTVRVGDADEVSKLLANKPLLGAIGIVLALCVAFAGFFEAAATDRMAGVALLMAWWWVFEVVPIPVTSLLPLALLPGLGIEKLKPVAAQYGKPVIFLFLGGLMLAIALSRCRLDRRLALYIVRAIGSKPSRLVLGFMVATAGLSMWISNTASVMVMLPIAMSVLAEAKSRGADPEDVAKVGTATMLSIAYAGNIGGMATPIGTPPNLVYVEMLQKLFPGEVAPSFGNWMMLGVPIVCVFIAVAWLLLTKVIFRLPAVDVMGDSAAIERAANELGPWRRDELVCGAVFVATALLWMTGSDLKLSDGTVAGWRSALAVPEFKDASVAVCAATLLFVLPSKDRPGEALLDWDAVKVLPWGLLLLFGGGFALAAGFSASGLSAAIGHAVAGLDGLPPWLLIGIVCTVMTFTTELTSNTATTTLVLPILGQAATVLGMDPRALMVPATLSASCAFMMPVATPPNAIVFGSGYIKIGQMVRAGLIMNIAGIVIITAMFLLLG